MVHRDGLGDLGEPDQLEPVRPLGARLVMVPFRQPGVDRRVRGDGAVDVSEPEEPADAVHHRVDRGVHQPGLPESADEQLPRGLAGLAPTGPARWSRTTRTSAAAGRRTGRGCARSSGPDTTPPPTAQASSTSAGTATEWSNWTWSHLTRRHEHAQPRPPPTRPDHPDRTDASPIACAGLSPQAAIRHCRCRGGMGHRRGARRMRQLELIAAMSGRRTGPAR